MLLTRSPPRTIAILRALQLGDLLCSVPAWRALRAACPQAQITLVGLPWARDLVARLDCLDDFVEFPGHAGMPERTAAAGAYDAFIAAMRARHFDLALPMHGSGGVTNAVVAAWGAQRVAGFFPSGEECPDREAFVPWREDGTPEIRRHLALVAHLGATPRGEHLELPVHAHEVREAHALLDALGLARQRYVCLHPGARFASRRWPAARFAAVADHLAQAGFAVLLTGTRDEAPVVRAVAAAMHAQSVDLTGRTTLGVLAVVVRGARLAICNDTGMSHVASAVGTPSVVVCSGADADRWRPLGRQHRLLAHPVPCRPCTHVVCPTAHECAQGITVDRVVAEARRLLAEGDERAAA
jgi:ADP-heptose:LPS heptosyltransferase